MRTIVTTGDAGREVLAGRDVTLADHAVERRGQSEVSRSACCASSSSAAALIEHGLPVAHFFERVLMPALGDLQRRVSGVEIRAVPRCLRLTKVSVRSFVSFASSSTASRLPDDRRVLDVIAVILSRLAADPAAHGPGAARRRTDCTRRSKSVGISRAMT